MRDGLACKIVYPTIRLKRKIEQLKLPTLEVQNEGNPKRIELWDTTIGTDVKLVTRPDSTNARQQIVPIADEIQAWTRRDADALCSIVCSVSDLVRALI